VRTVHQRRPHAGLLTTRSAHQSGSIVRVREELGQRVVYFSGALVRMHRAEVRQLVPVAVLDQIPLNLRQTPLMLGEYSFSLCAAHNADTTSRAPGTRRFVDERISADLLGMTAAYAPATLSTKGV
jgi:hypothetical protein